MNFLGRMLMKAHLIYLDYPVDPAPRYGYGLPAHARLLELVKSGDESYRLLLESFLERSSQVRRIPPTPCSDLYTGPYWRNGYIPALDTLSLYCLIADMKPARYFEIGSGHSTRFVRQAIEDYGLSTRIISIDPEPRCDIDLICDEVIREPLQVLDIRLFQQLQKGDLLFIDDGHRVFMNNGPTVFFMDILPQLAEGVILGFHDIFLPYDYPPEWERLYYSEQYLLGVFLLFANISYRVLLPAFHVSREPGLHSILDPIWNSHNLSGAETHGVSFWIELGMTRDPGNGHLHSKA